MSRRPHARVHLPPLSPRQAFAVVDVLERAIAAIERTHGVEMRERRELQKLEIRARRRHLTVCDLDADPDADFCPPPADRRSDPHHGDRPAFASVTIIEPVRDPTRQCERQQPENPHHLLVREPALAHLALRLGCRRGRVSRLDWSVKRRAGHHAHPRDEARITQGSIVENKHLADTLQWVAEQQRQRDRDRLTKPKISLREKNRIRMAANLTT